MKVARQKENEYLSEDKENSRELAKRTTKKKRKYGFESDEDVGSSSKDKVSPRQEYIRRVSD